MTTPALPTRTSQANSKPGLYRIMVKGHKDILRGSFSVLGECSGAGCPDLVTPDPLTAEQEAKIVDAFDSICPDTFCGGDFNYYGTSVTCDFAAKSCTMVFDTQSYYEEDVLPMTALDGVPDSERTVSGELSDDGGTYVGTMLEMVDKGEDGTWLRSSCQLTGSYESADDLLEASSSYARLNDTFYEQFLECLGELEGRFYSLY